MFHMAVKHCRKITSCVMFKSPDGFSMRVWDLLRFITEKMIKKVTVHDLLIIDIHAYSMSSVSTIIHSEYALCRNFTWDISFSVSSLKWVAYRKESPTFGRWRGQGRTASSRGICFSTQTRSAIPTTSLVIGLTGSTWGIPIPNPSARCILNWLA